MANDPGIVDENVESTEFCDRLVNDLANRRHTRQIGTEDRGAAAYCADLFGRLFRRRAPDQHHVCAGFGKRNRDSLPDSGIGTGDRSDTAGKIKEPVHSIPL